MEKAIFDTSVWINMTNNRENEQTKLLEFYLTFHSNDIYLTPTIIQEFLMGLRLEKDFKNYSKHFKRMNIIDLNWIDVSVSAAKLYFDLKKKGISVRKGTDCLIAQMAMEVDFLLVHNDSDFELIAKVSKLRTHKFT